MRITSTGKSAMALRMTFISTPQDCTRNSGRRRSAPTNNWHCIWLESATRTPMVLEVAEDSIKSHPRYNYFVNDRGESAWKAVTERRPGETYLCAKLQEQPAGTLAFPILHSHIMDGICWL